jgi:excisionase family DNA binding protein
METMLTVEEAAKALRLSRTKTFALLKDGSLRSVKIGRSRRVPVSALEAFIAKLVAAQA